MISIQIITLENLADFVKSDLYLSFTDKPISLLRVTSYIHNPNGKPNDIVLYMAFKDGILVGYRTILSDAFISDDKKVFFGWLSGNWVHPEYRRQNISTLLFNGVFKDWQGQLMYTNYAEASKAVYDKTTHFLSLKKLQGFRYYQRMSLAELLAPKALFFKKIKPVLSFGDWILNGFLDLRFTKTKTVLNNKDLQKITSIETDVSTFLTTFKSDELFQRNTEIYQWIQHYPWIKTDKDTQSKADAYYFSSFAEVFDNSLYKILNPKTKAIIAVINIQIKDKKMKIPYLYATENGYNLASNFILDLCKKQRLNYITIYDSKLNGLIQKSNPPFLFKKTFEQQFFVSKTLLNNNTTMPFKNIQTGDGDGVFS